LTLSFSLGERLIGGVVSIDIFCNKKKRKKKEKKRGNQHFTSSMQ